MSNLPPGCRERDVDGPCCHRCGEPADGLCAECQWDEQEEAEARSLMLAEQRSER